MDFWSVLGLRRGDTDGIAKAYREAALIYHPDKGGDGQAFAFIKMVRDVLMDPQKRREYEVGGGAAFTGPFSNPDDDDGGVGINIVTAPPINRDFLGRLLEMQGSYSLKIAARSMADYIRAILAQEFDEVHYNECKLARKMGIKLRLVPDFSIDECVVYSMARAIRLASFTAVDLIELDFPASHGQQMCKYARAHGIPSPTLEEAFGSTERIETFRNKPSHGLCPADVKRISNMLVYGAGRSQFNGALSPELKKLKAEITRVREHMWEHSPESWKKVMASRKHPRLTMCSVHCQLGERRDLDAVVAELPDGISPYGFLGDSCLVDKALDQDAFVAQMAEKGIYVTVKALPESPREYFKHLEAITGARFSQEPLTIRQRRRRHAVEYAKTYMGLREGPMPHLEFAIAIEEHLPTAYNPISKKTEFYNAEEGIWYPDGGQLVSKGEVLSDALMEVLGPVKWTWGVDDNGKVRIRLEARDVPMFHNGPVLAGIGEMTKHLRFDTSLPPLDRTPHAHKLVNFQGPSVLDFSVQKPAVDWDDDDQLIRALQLPLRESRMMDRTMRSVPRPFEEYAHEGRLELARAVRAAMLDLTTSDVLSEGVKAQLDKAVSQHPMMRHCFHEAHADWDSAIFQARLIFEPCSDTGVRCQVATFKDAGDGSTAKGTLRELCEACLGTFNGEAQLGYSCVLKQETIQTKDKEAPSEQTSNMYLCKHAWVDDFKPSKPLCTAVLRQLSGGNNITAARKHGREHQFKFRGQLFLVTNGIWTPDVPWLGSDARRATGLSFDVRFVDEPKGPNERAKDSGIKENLQNYFAEFWFMVRVFWLVEQPRGKSDQTMPQCPNTLALTSEILGGQFDNYELDQAVVEQFVEQRLMTYERSAEKPSSSMEIDLAFASFVREGHFAGFTDDAARRTLRRHMCYKAGHSLAACGGRKKTTVNVYVDDAKRPYTLKPAPLFGGASSSR